MPEPKLSMQHALVGFLHLPVEPDNPDGDFSRRPTNWKKSAQKPERTWRLTDRPGQASDQSEISIGCIRADDHEGWRQHWGSLARG
jgi:hypothetical protein